MSQIEGTAAQVQGSLRDLMVVWSADYNEPRVATARVFLNTSVRNIFDEVISRSTTPLEYQLSFSISDVPPQLDEPPVLGDPNTEQTIFRAGAAVFGTNKCN